MARPRSQSTKSTSAAKRTTAKRTTAKRTTAKRTPANKSTSAKSGTSTRAKQSTQFKCPECGASSKIFGSAAALGSHRKNSHGVVGASARTKTRQRAATTGTVRRGRPATAAATAGRSTSATNGRRRGRPPGSPNRPKTGTVNRDALLKTLLPGGIPLSEALIRESTTRDLSAWLDEAERLARTLGASGSTTSS